MESDDSVMIKKSHDDMLKFIADLSEATNVEALLQKHTECTVDRIECERSLMISHAFMSRYLPVMTETPSKQIDGNPESSIVTTPKSFYKFLCPLCLKLIYRCVTTVCGHSFCEMCLDEYLLIKSVSISLHLSSLELLCL
jgi:hypothetical protein